MTKTDWEGKLSEKDYWKRVVDLVFSYSPMVESNVKPLIQEESNVKKTEKVDI